jgi:hypothetical protein
VRHDVVFAQPPAQPQARHAEGLVLVGLRAVAQREGGLRHPPGKPEAVRVAPLHRYNRVLAPTRQAPLLAAQHQRGHQELEHRSIPGERRQLARDTAHRAAKVEPVLGRDIALGDGEVACEPRLAHQEVIVVRVELVGV